MRIFTKTIKVLGITKDELSLLQDLVQQARTEGKAEQQISSTEYLAIEVSDMYQRHPRNHREQ